MWKWMTHYYPFQSIDTCTIILNSLCFCFFILWTTYISNLYLIRAQTEWLWIVCFSVSLFLFPPDFPPWAYYELAHYHSTLRKSKNRPPFPSLSNILWRNPTKLYKCSKNRLSSLRIQQFGHFVGHNLSEDCRAHANCPWLMLDIEQCTSLLWEPM